MEKLAYPYQWLAPLTVKMINDITGELDYRLSKGGAVPGVDFEVDCKLGDFIAPARYSFTLRGLTDKGRQAVDSFAQKAQSALAAMQAAA